MTGFRKQALAKGVGGAAALFIAAAMSPAQAVDFEFHGDLNHRFQLFNNQDDFFNGFGSGGDGVIRDEDNARDGNFADFKYRLGGEVATDNDEVRGAVVFEIGGVRFGDGGDGGDFSGDGTNVETRRAYVDFAMPNAQGHRAVVGLQPHTVNKHIWWENATGVTVHGPLSDTAEYSFAWMRGNDAAGAGDVGGNDGFDSADGFSLNLDAELSPGLDAGAFVLYQQNDQASGTGVVDAIDYEVKSINDSRYDIWSIGTDGEYTMPMAGGSGFAKWNLIYQTGDIEDVSFNPFGGTQTATQDFDLSAFFGRADLGLEMGPTTFTYTFWYSSGDDNAQDNDFDAFMATDVDMFDSMIFFENFTDDNFFAETPYLVDKGFILNKFQVDHKLTPTVTLTGLASYHMLAEDVGVGGGGSEDTLGVELGGRISYKPYNRFEIATEAGYLIADDAMDAFEESAIRDGSSDEDLLHWAMRVRYKF